MRNAVLRAHGHGDGTDAVIAAQKEAQSGGTPPTQTQLLSPPGAQRFSSPVLATGQRKGSLFNLRWKHADFDHGTLASFKTKTGRAQYFVADRGLMTVLQAWHEHLGKPGDDEPLIPPARVEYEPKRLATALHDDLHAVGVTRGILFEQGAENVEPLRFHDLRATFCTWARRAGKSDAWISERTGHELDGSMINRYDRGAQTLDDLGYPPFPDIARVMPEFRERLATRLATGAGEAKQAVEETAVIPEAYMVGAGGFEPPTPRPPV
jgi:integrase